MTNCKPLFFCFLCCSLWAEFTLSETVTIDFEGVSNAQPIYQVNGADLLGDPVDGLSFGRGALGIVDLESGGSGPFSNAPSGDSAMTLSGYYWWPDSGRSVLNVEDGFLNSLSFSYSVSATAWVKVWSDYNGTGNLLGSLDLLANYSDGCNGGYNNRYCNWDLATLGLTGTAFSIEFTGTPFRAYFDNITFDIVDVSAVPIPAAIWFFGPALVILGIVRRRINFLE